MSRGHRLAWIAAITAFLALGVWLEVRDPDPVARHFYNGEASR